MGNLDSAMANGRAWYEDIKGLVERLQAALDKDVAHHSPASADERDAIAQQIQEGPLSVLVRDGWRQPGYGEAVPATGPEEYEILLSTGGPALRVWGKLGDHNEPSTAELQAQDWGTPWTRVPDCAEDVLLAYAQQFYFG